MAENAELLRLAPDQLDSSAPEPARSGITWNSVLIGATLFLVLAWSLPFWSLGKNYDLGMGGYLPLEAFILILLLMLFNRFGASLALVVGLATVAAFTPHWHAAVYAKTPAAAKMLPSFAGWLYHLFAGLIQPAQKSQWTPTLLVAAGALAAFAAGALPGWLAAAAAPALRRQMIWRELVVVFVLISVGVYSCRAVEFLVGVITVPYKGDNRERDFKRRFLRPVPVPQDADPEYNAAGVPSFLVPYDPNRFDESTLEGISAQKAEKEALAKFVRGFNRGQPPPPESSDAGQLAEYRKTVAEARSREWADFLARWKGPLKWWLPLLGLVLFLQVFLAALLQRQWADHEKLMFPHAEVVRALAEGEELGSRGRRVLSSPALWIGAGLAVALYALQGLNYYFPAVPAPNLGKISLGTFISERPWKAMDRTLNLQPFLVSISYLLTAEVSLSIWFFGVVNQGLRVAVMAWGLPRDDAWAVHGEEPNSDALYAGAMVVFVGALLWGGRRHLWYVARRGLGMAPADAAERGEAMSYPVAFWGFWLCLVGILGWCVLAGLKLWIMAVLFGLYLVLIILVCRLVAEAGILTASMGFGPFYPQFVFCHLFGFGQGATFGSKIAFSAGWLSAKGTLIPATLRCFGVWSFIWPSLLHFLPLAPLFMTGFKLTESEPRRKRLLTALMVAAVLIGALIFLHGTLTFAFEKGSQNTSFLGFNCPGWLFNNWLLRDAVTKERMWTPDGFRITMMGVGGLSMTALLVLRNAFYWWPLHPIGMAATGVGGMWVCFLMGWLFKRVALAFGGGEFSRRVRPFFYGLILGQFGMAAFWNLVGLCGTGCPDPGPLLPGIGY